MDEEEEEVQELEDDIHCVEGEEEGPFLTQVEYEGSLLDEQLNQIFDEKYILQAKEKSGYNLRSRNAFRKQNVKTSPKKATALTK